MRRRPKALLLLVAAILVTAVVPPTVAGAAGTTSIGAPQHFAAATYLGDYFQLTLSAPSDMREHIEAGTLPSYAKLQLDYRLDDGPWHYVPAWDTSPITQKNTIGVSFKANETYIHGDRQSLSSLFPADAEALLPMKNRGNDGEKYFSDHAVAFRGRLVVSFDGSKTYVISDWSSTYVVSNSVKSDPDALMNHAPELVSAEVRKNSGGQPYIYLRTGLLPGDVQDLNAMSGGAVWTQFWLKRAADPDFTLIHSSAFKNEYITFDVDDYFDKTQPNYDASEYQVKIRYKIDLRAYKQAGRSDTIYSPFSNVFTHNMPAWSNASTWAEPELQQADEAGLIPSILQGLDLTKPINREEFAEMAVVLYERTSGKASVPVTPNPFTDTTNPQILKAFSLGITNGTSPTSFSPEVLITREQCAAMLFRTLKAINPDGDFSYDGVPDFPDQRSIEAYAVPATKFMFKIGIIKGDSQGNFMPKATSTVQQASGYGMATREQALLMSVRTYGIYKKP